MANVLELFRGNAGDQNRRTIGYLVTDAFDDNDALNVLEVTAPFYYDRMRRENITIEELDKKAVNADGTPDITVADGIYRASAVYTRRKGSAPPPEEDQEPDTTGSSPDGNHDMYSFEQTLETVHIRETPYGTTRYVDNTGTPATEANWVNLVGINQQPDGTVEGVDIQRPIGGFTLSYHPSIERCPDSYQKKVRDLVGHTNSTPYMGHAVGEVWMTGATGQKRTRGDWELVYRFQTRANVSGQTIGSGSNQIQYSAQGWQYVWVYYDELDEQPPGNSEKRTILIPRQVNVETVYPSADFAELVPPPAP